MRSTILPLSLLLLAPAAPPQTQVNLGRQSKNVDFSQAPFTRPVQTGSNLPTTCTIGDLYFHTGVEAGKNLFGCTGLNTWLGLGSAALALATQEEAESGIENTHYMSPLRSAQAAVEQCALPAQSGHPGKLLKTDGSAATWTAYLTLPPSAVQTINAATDSIVADALNVRIDPNSNYALTSTPTIADGLDGQLLLISNNSASYSVTLQDENFLANSNLRLGGSNVTIVPRGSLLLAYNTALASWVRADTVGGGGGGGGITSLNSQTGTAQTFATGASGTNFSIASAGDIHTFHLPDAGPGARGVVATTAQTFAGKKTFSPTAASAGLNLGSATSDPSSPANGDTYYNSSTNKFRCYQNGAWADCIASGGGGGITSLNSQTGTAQTFTTGASGTDFSIASAGDAHTFNLPNAGASARGVVSTTAQTFAGKKTFSPTATSAGLNLGSATSDPSSPADGDTYYNSSTHKFRCYQNGAWTDCIGAGGGGVSNEVDWITYRAARCQNTVAGAGFSTPTTGAPTPACVEGTNTLYGVLQFSDSSTQTVQDHFALPTGVSTVDLYGKWRTSATSGTAVWQIATACVADGETGDPSWNTAQAAPDAAQGTAWRFNGFSLEGVTLTGCAAGETMFFKFFRDPAHASDDLGATAELIELRFKVTR